MDNFKEHLHLIKRDKLEDFYQVVRETYFKTKKKTTSNDIIKFLNDEVSNKNRLYTWINLLDLLDKSFFENSREKFHKLTTFIIEEELNILHKKGVFEDKAYPLFIYFNNRSFSSGSHESYQFFQHNKVYSSIPKDLFFEYSLKHQEYDYLLYSDDFSKEDKHDFLLDSIREFENENQITRLLMSIYDRYKGMSLCDIVSYEEFIDAIIKEDKVKFLTVDGLNCFAYNEGEFKENEPLIFFNKCYPFMNEKSQNIVKDKFPMRYAQYEQYTLSKNLKDDNQFNVRKRL